MTFKPGSMRVRVEDDGGHYLEIFKRDGTWATWDRYDTMAMAKEGARCFPRPPDGHTRKMTGDKISVADLVEFKGITPPGKTCATRERP